MRTARNIAIIALLAVPVAFVPGGGNVAEALLTALILGFLAGISYMVYTLYRRSELTLSALADSRRAILYGAAGGIVLLVAAHEKLLGTGAGFLLWIALIAACGFAIFTVWREANTY